MAVKRKTKAKYKIHTCSACGHKERRPLYAHEIGSAGGAKATGSKKRRPPEHYKRLAEIHKAKAAERKAQREAEAGA